LWIERSQAVKRGIERPAPAAWIEHLAFVNYERRRWRTMSSNAVAQQRSKIGGPNNSARTASTADNSGNGTQAAHHRRQRSDQHSGSQYSDLTLALDANAAADTTMRTQSRTPPRVRWSACLFTTQPPPPTHTCVGRIALDVSLCWQLLLLCFVRHNDYCCRCVPTCSNGVCPAKVPPI